jgi:transketolase
MNQDLVSITNRMRAHIVEMLAAAGSGHPGGSLSAVDIIAMLYFKHMRVDPGNPRWEDRDRFVMSKGHSCPVQYAALGELGFFDAELLNTLRKEGSILQGHPDMKRCPGIDISTGSLGQGLACAVGMAMSAKADGKDYRVFCVVGDGECDEGEIWEACNTAAKYGLDNLIVYVDSNGLQLDGPVAEIMPLGDIAGKFAAFGFETWNINGNDMAEVVDALEQATSAKDGKPKAIVGKTVKGNGVSFMENQVGWHGKAPNEEQCRQALAELDAAYVK